MFEDLSSREPSVLFLKAKSEAFSSYKEFEAWVKVHRNPDGIACLGSDRGGEFMSEEFITPHMIANMSLKSWVQTW
jgi:hypothetical protein